MRFVAAFACAVVLVCFGVVPSHAEKRVALVIGNSAYPGAAALENPVNDAADVAAALRRIGFEVIEGKNLSLADFSQIIDVFRQKAKDADAALFYYAGHGMQFEEQNWLMPIDTRVTNAFDVRHFNVALQDLMSDIEGSASATLVFLDACRDNPLDNELKARLRAQGRGNADVRGLARVEFKAPETLVVFATRPNTLAADGKGRRNSPFTEAFLENVAKPGIEIEALMKRVTASVAAKTQGKQQPERLSRLVREFYFVPASAPPTPTASPVRQSQSWTWCVSEGNAVSPDRKIGACVAVIQSGQATPPDLAVAFASRGLAYRAKGDHDHAIADYSEAIALDKKFTEAYRNRGVAYVEKGDFDRAFADFDEAIKIDPKNAISYDQRGVWRRNRGDNDHAIADFDEAIRLDPNRGVLYFNRAIAWGNKGERERAIADYTESIRRPPPPINAYGNRGELYAGKGDFDHAIADFSDAIRLDPKRASFFNSRGLAYNAKGDHDRAIADYDEAIKLDPKYANAVSNRNMALEAKRNVAAPLSPERERALKAKDVFKECDKCPEMVVVPAGSFTMGSPANEAKRSDAEEPQHAVTIAKPFAIGKFHVTVDQFAAFVAETGYDTGSKCFLWEGDKWVEKEGHSWRNPGFAQTGSHPAVCLNWDDAKAYAAWLAKKTGKSHRLLSEAEWEYAARAGTTTAYSWGNEIGKGNANCRGCGSNWDGKQTAPVGSFAPNAFGLYDMHGNATQWLEDCWNGNYTGAPADGSAWVSAECDRRDARGGSWFHDPGWARSANRNWHRPPSVRFYVRGFRVGRTL
jgi:formylglycine-generating enzyme required for sulfatase activity/Tfp pilus assembly protein PilF